ncbi:MAG: lipopolysaccharide transport periplasmic protein LptA [Desulfamplus sp.]|nr:lipopolysaccharide transport periplasmic protein LptA [Desulfamplus sp.]
MITERSSIAKFVDAFHIYIFIVSITIICLLCPYLNQTAQGTDGKEKMSTNDQQKTTSTEEKKLHITSDSMLVEKESSIATFSGNVVATQGNSVITADSVIVLLFTDKEKKANPANMTQEIKSITASGNVKFTSDNRTAFADKAIYTASDQKIVLTGNAPKVMTGESYVTGKRIILFQNSGKVIVEGTKDKRVEALFNSKDDFKQTN